MGREALKLPQTLEENKKVALVFGGVLAAVGIAGCVDLVDAGILDSGNSNDLEMNPHYPPDSLEGRVQHLSERMDRAIQDLGTINRGVIIDHANALERIQEMSAPGLVTVNSVPQLQEAFSEFQEARLDLSEQIAKVHSLSESSLEDEQVTPEEEHILVQERRELDERLATTREAFRNYYSVLSSEIRSSSL